MDEELEFATETNDKFNTTINVNKLPENEQKNIQDVIDIMTKEIESRNGVKKQWKLSDFQIGRPLGRGQFGRVYFAREKKSKLFVALKTLIKKELMNGRMQHQVLREIEIQTHLHHPNVLQLYSYFHDEKRIYLVLEYAGNGELFTHLQNQKNYRFSERRSAKYTYQVADALEYCHQQKVMHRDIKPENLLIDIYDNIKLSDFGWSVHAPSNKRKTKCGTLDYLPPEMIESKVYTNQVDHWCLGVLCYEFLVGRPPFESPEEKLTYEKIRRVQIYYPSYLTPGSIDLMSKLIRYNPEERISFREIKTHPWLVENKNKFLSG